MAPNTPVHRHCKTRFKKPRFVFDAGTIADYDGTGTRGALSSVTWDGAAPTTAATTTYVIDGICTSDDPYVVTSDVTAPTVTISASDDNWMTTLYNGAPANGRRVTFRIELSEMPALIVGTAASTIDGPVLPSCDNPAYATQSACTGASGTWTAAGNGDLTTGHLCAEPVWSGTGRIYYLRCNAIDGGWSVTMPTASGKDPANAANDLTAALRTIAIEIAATKFKDLAGNDNTASSALSAGNAKYSVVSDISRPTAVVTASSVPAAIGAGKIDITTANANTIELNTADPTIAVGSQVMLFSATGVTCAGELERTLGIASTHEMVLDPSAVSRPFRTVFRDFGAGFWNGLRRK